MTFRSLAPDECIIRCNNFENAQKTQERLKTGGLHPELSQVINLNHPYEIILRFPEMGTKVTLPERNQMRLVLLAEFSSDWRLLEPNETVLVERQILEIGETDRYPPSPKRKSDDAPIEITLPDQGVKLVGDFCDEVANVFKDKKVIFYRPATKDIVQIGVMKDKKTGLELNQGFLAVSPQAFVTLAELFIIPGKNVWDARLRDYEFKEKSINPQLASIILASNQLRQALPQITRIFSVPLPIMYEGQLTFPKKGYDERFSSWLPVDAPDISNPNMTLAEAKNIIDEILSEFCWKSRQDYCNALAAMLTPFLRGLLPQFNTRVPLFMYLANRERAGKDYLRGCTTILYEGMATEEPPISTNENNRSNNTEELRKKLLATFINGKKMLHFANNKGYLNNATLEEAITGETFSDRVLGKNESMVFNNELEISMSGNIGIGFTADIANRTVFINLHLEIENANDRIFKNDDLWGSVKKARGLILSALYTMVRTWIDAGMPDGNKPFASFPHWAKICGGIMESCGYENPCNLSTQNTFAVGGDSDTDEMKALFELCYAKYPDKFIAKHDIIDCLQDEGICAYLNLSERSDQIKFGNKLQKFVGRIFNDIQLIVDNPKLRSSRQNYKFTKQIVPKELISYKEELVC